MVELKKALRVKQVALALGISVVSVWRRAKYDTEFPKPYKIGPNSTVWDEISIEDYKERCREGSRSAA